jgi:hypothetical protein
MKKVFKPALMFEVVRQVVPKSCNRVLDIGKVALRFIVLSIQ